MALYDEQIVYTITASSLIDYNSLLSKIQDSINSNNLVATLNQDQGNLKLIVTINNQLEA